MANPKATKAAKSDKPSVDEKIAPTTKAKRPKLAVVPERSEAQMKWEARDRERRARAQGLSVEELAASEDYTEDWRQDLAVEREPAGAEYAGLYHLKHGHLGVPRLSQTPILAGRKVRLNADEGRCASESGVGVRIAD